MPHRYDITWPRPSGARGPKNFKRLDSRIRDDIAERLMLRDDIDSSDASVEVRDGRVILEGSVPERWMKFAIDDIAESVLGVREVQNNLRVRPTPDRDELRAETMGARRR
ncbi:MAG TPA: BON domain-containing protein [Steroidobacteraceae bacterium]|nr:BON domain-containing protein [Steroidobacteraceae bacterium]